MSMIRPIGIVCLAVTASCGPTVTVEAAPTSPPTSAPVPSTAAPAAATTSVVEPAPDPSITVTRQVPPTGPPSTPLPVLDIAGSPLLEFSVAVGDGTNLDRDELTAFVVTTLSDERSWISRGAGFRLIDEGGDFTIVVAEPTTVDDLCAPLQTNGIFSCARNGNIAINSLRWFGATEDWPGDLETYRRYLVNHEVGHYILGPNHSSCPEPGQPAPIMMQQTKGLDGCLPNGWVTP